MFCSAASVPLQRVHACIYVDYVLTHRETQLTRRFARQAYCLDRGVPLQRVGKLLVATSAAELPKLEAIRQQALTIIYSRSTIAEQYSIAAARAAPTRHPPRPPATPEADQQRRQYQRRRQQPRLQRQQKQHWQQQPRRATPCSPTPRRPWDGGWQRSVENLPFDTGSFSTGMARCNVVANLLESIARQLWDRSRLVGSGIGCSTAPDSPRNLRVTTIFIWTDPANPGRSGFFW